MDQGFAFALVFCARAKPIFLALIIRWNNFACRKLGRGLKVCSGKWISINNTAYNIVKSQLESAKEGKINIFLETTICVCCSNFLCVQSESFLLRPSYLLDIITQCKHKYYFALNKLTIFILCRLGRKYGGYKFLNEDCSNYTLKVETFCKILFP